MATQASKESYLRWPPASRRRDPCVRDSNDGGTAHPDDPDGEIPRWSGFVWIPLLVLAILFHVGLLSVVWRAFF